MNHRAAPWELTQAEYVERRRATSINPNWPEASVPEWLAGWEGNQRLAHRLHVRRAIRAGEQVPDAVLAEYPELKEAVK